MTLAPRVHRIHALRSNRVPILQCCGSCEATRAAFVKNEKALQFGDKPTKGKHRSQKQRKAFKPRNKGCLLWLENASETANAPLPPIDKSLGYHCTAQVKQCQQRGHKDTTSSLRGIAWTSVPLETRALLRLLSFHVIPFFLELFLSGGLLLLLLLLYTTSTTYRQYHLSKPCY